MFGLRVRLCVIVICTLVPKAYAANLSFKGKYQLVEYGSNVTGSHSHVSSSYLTITDDSAVYFSTDNGDIIGNKEILNFKASGQLVEFFYRGCLETDFNNIDKHCAPEKLLNTKRYIFEKTKKGLVLKWGGFSKGDIYKRVKKFDFE
jgi:hypothetical protein